MNAATNSPAAKTKKQKWTAVRNYAWRETVDGKKQTVTKFFVSCDGVSVGQFIGRGAAPSTRKADAIRLAQASQK